jgi:hypothetical protein
VFCEFIDQDNLQFLFPYFGIFFVNSTNLAVNIGRFLFIGGLKSLFIELAEALDEVEKTGAMRADMVGTLVDAKTAIDLTLKQLQSAQVRCCDHSPECEQDDDEDDDEEQVGCMNCGESCDSAYCHSCEDSEDYDEEDGEETVPVALDLGVHRVDEAGPVQVKRPAEGDLLPACGNRAAASRRRYDSGR